MKDRLTDEDTSAAAAATHRYVVEAVEQLQICPFARACREKGMLAVRVLPAMGETLEVSVGRTLEQLQDTDDDAFEVALIVAPGFLGDAHQWEALANELDHEASFRLRSKGRTATCWTVAFHPQMPYDTGHPAQLVGLMRHSPFPTLQLTRRSVMDRVRDPVQPAPFVDPASYASPEEALRAAESVQPRPSVSDRITAHNYATWQRMGGALEQLFDRIRVQSR